MRRAVVVAFALLASVLVATTPVAASHQLTVASIHTTDTDFNGGTLNNMTVTGTGNSASVALETPETTLEGFEDGDASNWQTIAGNSITAVQTTTNGSGAFDGSWMGEVAMTGGNNARNRLTLSGSKSPVNASVAIRIENAGGDRGIFMFRNSTSGDVVFSVAMDTRGANITVNWNAPGEVDTGVAIEQDRWFRVEFVDIDWSTDTIGEVLINGSVVATNVGFQNSADGFDRFEQRASGGDTAQSYSDVWNITRTSVTPGEYLNTHTATNTEQGFVDITTNTNATATVTWETSDGGAWHTLNQTSGITTTGNKTFTWATESNSTVRVNVTVENATGNGAPAFAFADEGVQFTASSPTVDNASASPTGELSSATQTFEIDVNDSDFPLAQGDTATAELFIDGNSEGTDTLTSNGTASVTATVSGGDHTYEWTVTDDYGHSQDSQTFSVSAPGNLTIRNETSPYGIVSGCTATVRFFEDVDNNPTIVERTDADGDGNISLAGLPVDGEFTVSMKCDGYHNRTIIIEDIFAQQSAFMLATDRPSVQNRFTVADRTGDFPAEDTEIIIQKAINRSKYDSSASGFSWTNVAGDDLGASEEYVVDLEEGDRYRIVVQNEDGDQRILGAHNADIEGTFNLIIGRVILDPEGTAQPAYSANRTNLSGAPVRVDFEYNDSRENTTRIWLHIYEYDNSSNELLANTSFTPGSGNYGTFTHTENVPSSDNETTWVVEFTAEREGDLANVNGQIIVGPQQDILPDLPPWLATVIFVGSMFVVAGLFSQLNGHVGGLVIAGMAALFYFAGVAPPELGGGVVMLALITAGIIFANEHRGAGL